MINIILENFNFWPSIAVGVGVAACALPFVPPIAAGLIGTEAAIIMGGTSYWAKRIVIQKQINQIVGPDISSSKKEEYTTGLFALAYLRTRIIERVLQVPSEKRQAALELFLLNPSVEWARRLLFFSMN